MQDLRADHRNLPELKAVTITVADVQHRIKNMKSWTAPGPDMIHTYWLKHLTAVHERLAAQMNQLLASGSHPDWLTQGKDGASHERPPQGNNTMQLDIECSTMDQGVFQEPVQFHSLMFCNLKSAQNIKDLIVKMG